MRLFKGLQTILTSSLGGGPWFHMHLWLLVLCLVCLGRIFFWDLMLTQEKAHHYLCKKHWNDSPTSQDMPYCYSIGGGKTVLLFTSALKLTHAHAHPSQHRCLSFNCLGEGKKSIKKTSIIEGIRMVAHSLSLIEFLHALFSLFKFFALKKYSV